MILGKREEVIGSDICTKFGHTQFGSQRFGECITQWYSLDLPIRTVNVIQRLVSQIVIEIGLSRTRKIIWRVFRCPIVQICGEVSFSLRIVSTCQFIVNHLSPTSYNIYIQIEILITKVIIESSRPFWRLAAEISPVIIINNKVAIQILQFYITRLKRLCLLCIFKIFGSFLCFIFLPYSLIDKIMIGTQRTANQQTTGNGWFGANDILTINQIGNFLMIGSKGKGGVPLKVFVIHIDGIYRYFNTTVHGCTDILIHLERSCVTTTHGSRQSTGQQDISSLCLV